MGEEREDRITNVGEVEKRLEEDLAKLPPELLKKLSEGIALAVMEAVFKKSPPKITDHLRVLGFTEEVAGLLQSLECRTDDTSERVLWKALNLYKIALEAREEGNRLAVLDPDDVIVHEVVGFKPAESADPVAT